jgi:hypothetical protein
VTEDLRQRDVSKLPDATGPYTPSLGGTLASDVILRLLG